MKVRRIGILKKIAHRERMLADRAWQDQLVKHLRPALEQGSFSRLALVAALNPDRLRPALEDFYREFEAAEAGR